MNIRAMTSADIPCGLALCRASGWNQVEADWAELLALGGSRCFAAEVEGRLVGTVTAIAYERRFAWIGMVLVDPALRGQGIGTALTARALDALGDIPARLDATPDGYPLYCRLGFVDEARLVRLTRDGAGTGQRSNGPQPDAGLASTGAPLAVRPMDAGDFAAVCSWDREVFGANRGSLLEWARASVPGLAQVANGDAGLRGYCFGRQGHRWSQVGPVVARDEAAGAALVAACALASGGAPIVLDAVPRTVAWTGRLAGLGFTEQRPFIRMRRGPCMQADQNGEELAIFGPEWG